MEPFPLQITWILIYNVIVVTAQTNVALISKGSQCESLQPNCEYALDGVSGATRTTNRWSFFGEAQGNWIKVTFNQTYTIYTARFMQLAFAEESNFKDLELTFENGTKQQVTLTIREAGFQWEEFTLDPPVETTFVDVFILTAYSTGRTYSGFSEIEFYDGLLTTISQAPTTSFITEKSSTSYPTTTITMTPDRNTEVTTYSTAATTVNPTTTTTIYPTTITSTYPTTTRFTTSSTIIATTNGMEETITENAEKVTNVTGVVVGATVGSIIILLILGGMLFLFFKFRQTSNELQKMKKNMSLPAEQPVYYNVAGPHNTEYEEIKETQDSPYQVLKGDVSDHPSSSQYQELQVVSQ